MYLADIFSEMSEVSLSVQGIKLTVSVILIKVELSKNQNLGKFVSIIQPDSFPPLNLF